MNAGSSWHKDNAEKQECSLYSVLAYMQKILATTKLNNIEEVCMHITCRLVLFCISKCSASLRIFTYVYRHTESNGAAFSLDKKRGLIK